MPVSEEEARLDALRRLDLLDGPFRDGFDRITRTACKLFDVPYAAIAITGRERHSLRSRIGMPLESVPRRALPGAWQNTISSFVSVPDLLNSRYSTGELVSAGIRFYAAAPLITADGITIGALCVLDREVRAVSAYDAEALTDLAELLMAQIELRHSNGHIDTNSGMPNRAQFIEDMEALASDHPNERRLLAVIDLASPEQLMTSVRVMGTGYLDAIVLEAAERIESMMGPRQKAYHVTGTQFACLAPPHTDEAAYYDCVSAQLQELRATNSARFVTTTTVGIAPFQLGRHKPLDVLRMAHNAAQDARLTDSRVAIYAAEQDATHQRRFAILEAFGYALEHPEELSLTYQPRIDLGSGECRGVEALLRWRSCKLGPVSPAEFVPLVEQSGMIRGATALVLQMSLRQLAEWRAAGLALEMAVNVSAMNLLEHDFVERLAAQLAETGLDPSLLEIEMTESAFIGETNLMLSMARTIADLGVRLAIDDFGTGYSGLSYLQRLPAQIVKIDRSFIRDLATEAGNRAVVRATVSLCHDLGYRVVAEGVETKAALDLVTAAGCDEAQGFLFAEPLPAEAFLAWLKSHAQGAPAAAQQLAMTAVTSAGYSDPVAATA